MKKLFELTSVLVITLLFTVIFAFALTPAEVRTQPLGSAVTVTGYAFSGTDSDGTGFGNEFYLSDRSNAKGICVTLSEGDKITLFNEYSVKGILQKDGGELKLQATSVTPLSDKIELKLYKRPLIEDALNYAEYGGTFVRLSGEASLPVLNRNLLSSFTLSKDGKQIRIIIESGVYSLSKGESGKTELTEKLRYKRNVTVDGFVAKLGDETVIRIKDCDDIDVQHHNCVFGEAVTEKEPSCGVTGLSVKVCYCGMREETVIPALSHSFYEETERSSTCTTAGLKVKKCRNCNFREEASLPLKDHSYAEKTEIPATCDKEGVHLRYCRNCTLRIETPIAKTEHKFKEKTEKEATCTESGIYVRYCSGCSFREETIIPETEHSYRERTEVEPTCEREGICVRYCYYCSFREETAIPKNAHSFAEKVETPATCTSEGVYLRYCRSCTLREETPIPKTDHSFRERTEVEPTCEREGIRVRYCYYCSFREETAIPKNAHSFAEKVEAPATCTSEGVYLRYCRSCTLREETPIPKTEHKFKEKTEKEPTCTEEGIKVKYCSDCDFREETRLPKKEHTLSEKVEKKPTCTAEGLSVKFCKSCTLREETVIAKTEHSFKEKTEKEPSCTEEGLRIKCCSDCDYRAETILSKTEHNYKEKLQKATFTTDGSKTDICSVCGDKKNLTVISAVNNIVLSEDCFIYDGKAHAPKITLRDKDGKAVTDFELICESRKEIGKHSLTIELKGNYSGRKTLYYTIVPADVTDIKSAVTSKSATLTFDESKGADGYRIYYINGTKTESLGTFTKNSCTVTLPEYGKTYTIIIRAYKKADDTTLWSEGVSFRVSTGPDNVSGIKAESNFYSVKLSWDKTETADGYRVYVKGTNGKYKILTTTEKTSFTVNGLSASTKYDFAVKAYRKADGKTIWGNSMKKVAETSSGKPSSFSGKESYNSVALSWREVKGADGYKVYVYSSKKKKYTTLKSVKSNKYTAEELKSGTTYKFAVKPYTKKNGKTYYGKPVYLTVTTKLTRPILTAKITAKGNTLSWNKVNGADGYVIYYSTEKDGSYTKLKTTTAAAYTHTKASKSKKYYYKVRAYKTVSGEKIYSSFSTVKKAAR